MNTYYRKQDKSLGQINVDVESHKEAILLTKDHLQAAKETFYGPVLALINNTDICKNLTPSPGTATPKGEAA